MILDKVLTAGPKPGPVCPDDRRNLLRAIGEAIWERRSPHFLATAPAAWGQLVEATPDFVFTADRRGHLQYANPAALQMLGVGSRDARARINLAAILSPASQTRVLGEGVFAAILDGSWSGEAALVSKAGREIPVSLVIVAPLAPDGEREFLSIVARDISQLKRNEEAYEHREQLFQSLVETAQIGIGAVD